MGNSLLCHYIDNCFKKGIILWGQKQRDWGAKLRNGGICPPVPMLRKALLAPRYLYNMFVANSSDSSYNLRNTATDLKLPKKTSFNGQKGLTYNGAKVWNSLLTESKLAPSLASFKKSLVHMT